MSIKKVDTSKQNTAVRYSLIFLVAVATILLLIFILNSRSDSSRSESTNTSQINSGSNYEVEKSNTTISKLPADKFSEIIMDTSKPIQLVDMRTPQEYQTGRIADAQLIDYYSSDFEQKLAKLDPDLPIAIYCNSGNRSSSALSTLEDLGFSEVLELQNGIQGWMNTGLAIDTDFECTVC